jgi:hypothetical protein
MLFHPMVGVVGRVPSSRRAVARPAQRGVRSGDAPGLLVGPARRAMGGRAERVSRPWPGRYGPCGGGVRSRPMSAVTGLGTLPCRTAARGFGGVSMRRAAQGPSRVTKIS